MVFFFCRIKDKINDPPEKRDFQKVSHSLARFIKLKEEAKNSGKNSKKGKLKRQNVGKEDKPGKKTLHNFIEQKLTFTLFGRKLQERQKQGPRSAQRQRIHQSEAAAERIRL